MKIFDSHCHLDDPVFNMDFEQVLIRAASADVLRMMIAGIDKTTSERALDLATRFPNLFASVGVHPHEAQSCSEETIAHLMRLASDPRVVAWGETGLDFNRMHSPKKDQEKWFARQLEAADALDLPLIFHERDSNGRLLEFLRGSPCPGRKAVVHCFSGSESELAQYLDMGFYIGVTGIVTIKKRGAALRRMIPCIPKDRIVVETDAPYLTPSLKRNRFRRNEPAFVREVLFEVADLLKADPHGLADQVWSNTCALFRIDPADSRTTATG